MKAALSFAAVLFVAATFGAWASPGDREAQIMLTDGVRAAGGAGDARSVHELALAKGEELAANQAGERHPADEAEDHGEHDQRRDEVEVGHPHEGTAVERGRALDDPAGG